MTQTNNDVKPIESTDLLGWLRGKLADAEQSLKGREALANPPTISEEEWERLKSLPGTIVGKSRKPSKAKMEERRLELLRHKRIAVKCRHEVEMFRAVIAALSLPNAEVSHAAPPAASDKPTAQRGGVALH